MFNWLSVIVLTLIELSTGLLEKTSQIMVDHMVEENNNGTYKMASNASSSSSTGPDLLKPLTKPFTNLIVQVDKKVLIGWSFQVRISRIQFFKVEKCTGKMSKLLLEKNSTNSICTSGFDIGS